MKNRIFNVLFFAIIALSSLPVYGSTFGALGRLDSIVYELNDLSKVRKSVYEYTNKSLSSISIYEANALNSAWNPIQKNLLSEADTVQSVITQTYSIQTTSFINSLRNDYKFDNKANCTLEASYVWDETTSSWKGFRSKLERTYVDSGVISSYTYSDWDSISNNWKIYSKGSIKFTSFNKPEEIYYSTPDNANQLVPSSKIVVSYQPDYQPDYETTFGYDPSEGYKPSFRTHFEYSGTAPQYTETLESAGSNGVLWTPVQKIEKSFNANGDLSNYTVSDRDTLSQTWKERFRHEFTIQSNATDSIYIQQIDNPKGTTLFTKKYKQINNNDLSSMTNTIEENGTTVASQISQITTVGGNLNKYSNSDDLENISLEWNFDASNNKLQCLYFLQKETSNQPNLIRKSTFNFSNGNVATPIVKEGNLTFGPNPVNDYLTIHNSTPNLLSFKIVTLEGKPVIMGSSADKSTTVQTKGLQPGAYILQLTLGKDKSRSSLIIKK